MSSLAIAPLAARPRDGVNGREVVFGQNAVLSGVYGAPVAAFVDGARAAFEAANAEGGVAGRKIRLTSLDDGLSPEQAALNCRELLFGPSPVFALFGCVGSATTLAAAHVADEAGATIVGAIGVGDSMRDHLRGTTCFVRATIARESEFIARHLSTLGLSRVAVAFVDTPGGAEVARQLDAALRAHGVGVAASAPLRTDGANAAAAASALAAARPQALIMWLAAPVAAPLMQGLQRLGARPLFVGMSIVAGDHVAKLIGDAARGLTVTQVMPYPWADRTELHAYQKAMGGRSGIRHLSLEGWVTAQLAIHALQQCGTELTRERFAGALRTTRRPFAGLHLDFSNGGHTGSRYVELLAVRADGSFVR